jgi:hypothetical protein
VGRTDGRTDRRLAIMCVYIVARMRGDYYKTGIGLTIGFIGSQSVTQLGYSVLHFTTHNN